MRKIDAGVGGEALGEVRVTRGHRVGQRQQMHLVQRAQPRKMRVGQQPREYPSWQKFKSITLICPTPSLYSYLKGKAFTSLLMSRLSMDWPDVPFASLPPTP